MQQLIQFFSQRLKEALPHSEVREEGLDPKVLKLLLEEEKNTKAQFQKIPPRICAVLIAMYEDNGSLCVPMMLRPTKSRAHPGQIAFPGGKKEEQDQDLIETAIREMEEEIGVAVPKINILGSLTPVYIPPSNSLVTPILGYLNSKPSYIPAPDEVERVLDVKMEDLANPANKRAKKVILTNGEYFEMPAFAVNDVLIWGGTAHMIIELNKLMKEFG